MDNLPKKLIKSGVRVGRMDCDDKVVQKTPPASRYVSININAQYSKISYLTQANLKFCKLYGFRESYALSGFFQRPEQNPYTRKVQQRFQHFIVPELHPFNVLCESLQSSGFMYI